jgi:hypothetical protein
LKITFVPWRASETLRNLDPIALKEHARQGVLGRGHSLGKA